MDDAGLIVVYPSALLGWEVLIPEEEEPRVFDDRAGALQCARDVAAYRRPCRVRIEDWYGHVECEWVFAVDPTTTT